MRGCILRFRKQHDVRGEHPNRIFDQMEAGFACGSMVLFYLFHTKFCTKCKILCEKDGFFRPTGSGAA